MEDLIVSNAGVFAFLFMVINMVAWFVLDTFMGVDGAKIITHIYIAAIFLGSIIWCKK